MCLYLVRIFSVLPLTQFNAQMKLDIEMQLHVHIMQCFMRFESWSFRSLITALMLMTV